MSILSGIVLYNPNINDLKKSIDVLINFSDEILMINNNIQSKDINDLSSINDKITIINLGENKGIAFALNCILDYSINHQYDYTLTLDQDSICDKNMICEYLLSDETDVALFTPQIIDLNKRESTVKGINRYVDVCITSGCLIKNRLLKNKVRFDDSFFIDFVDFDFSLSVIELGYKIKYVSNAYLYHHLGKAQEIKVLSNIFRRPIFTFNHNANRTFYYNKNAILLMKKHPYTLNKMLHILRLLKWDLLKITFEKDRLTKFKAIISGLVAGLKGKC